MHARGDARHHPAAPGQPSHVGHLPSPGTHLFPTNFQGNALSADAVQYVPFLFAVAFAALALLSACHACPENELSVAL